MLHCANRVPKSFLDGNYSVPTLVLIKCTERVLQGTHRVSCVYQRRLSGSCGVVSRVQVFNVYEIGKTTCQRSRPSGSCDSDGLIRS